MNVAHEVQRVAFVTLDDAAAILDLDARAAGADADLRRQADERVAAEALAADDRFEQERVALLRELEVERQRRVEIGERLEHQRNAVVAKCCERAEFAFGDHGNPAGWDGETVRGGVLRCADARREGSRWALRRASAMNRARRRGWRRR